MVCNRCIMVVRSELEKFGLPPVSVKLGEIEISEDLEQVRKTQLNTIFQELGFAIIDDKKSRWIEKIKTAVVELVYYSKKYPKNNFFYLSVGTS